MTAVLQIEHPMADFERCRQACAREDADFRLIDLEIDTPDAAEALLTSLRQLASRAGPT